MAKIVQLEQLDRYWKGLRDKITGLGLLITCGNGAGTVTIDGKNYTCKANATTLIDYKTAGAMAINGDYITAIRGFIRGNNSDIHLTFPTNCETYDVVFKDAKPVDLLRIFQQKSITNANFSTLDTSDCTNMANMFRQCYYLTSVNLSGANTEKVTNMSYMFYQDIALTELTAFFDFTNCTTASCMFNDCSHLATINGGFCGGAKLTTIDNMFRGCTILTGVDLSNCTFSNCTSMYYTFWGCNALQKLDTSNWGVGNVTTFYATFSRCQSLADVDVSKWDVSKATTMNSMFYQCLKFTKLDCGNWDTRKVTDLGYFMAGCDQCKVVNLLKWDTRSVTNMNQAFYYLPKVTSFTVGTNFFNANIETFDLSGLTGWQDRAQIQSMAEAVCQNDPVVNLKAGMYPNIKWEKYELQDGDFTSFDDLNTQTETYINDPEEYSDSITHLLKITNQGSWTNALKTVKTVKLSSATAGVLQSIYNEDDEFAVKINNQEYWTFSGLTLRELSSTAE